MRYIVSTYGTHPALYRFRGRPLLYVYDSYRIADTAWADYLSRAGAHSVRGTANDVFAVGLLVEESHKGHVLQSGFDGTSGPGSAVLSRCPVALSCSAVL